MKKKVRRLPGAALLLAFLLLNGASLMAQEPAGELAALTESVQKAADSANGVTTGLNVMWVLLGGMLVFFMQAGFALVETGFTRPRTWRTP